MAIALINSQNLTMMIESTTIPSGTPVYSDFATADEVGCPQSIGTIEETRAVTEYKCMSSNESAKALGSIERGNLEIGLLFDPADAAGQAALKQAFIDNPVDGVLIGIELDNGIVSGTTFAFIGRISGVSVGIEQDAAITYTVTVEIASDVTEIALADA